MPESAAGLSERRERKNDVDIISNCQPSLRAIPSAFGTFGVSMKPKRNTTRENVLPTGSMRKIELRRDGKLVTTLDLYQLIANGDESKKAPLRT